MFAAIVLICPAIKAQISMSATDDAATLRQQIEILSLKVDSLSAALHKTDPHSVSASDTEIKLNFKFKDNEATFYKALSILGIGFSTVFVVMIIFILVSSQIDKRLPYRKENE
jgi:hypothetical protein